jgi:tRNA pseudouridine55 synthase
VPIEHAADGVLLVDKPAGITSTRALAIAKRALGSRKAGHTGTLDPFATGLLPLVFGEATKFSRFLIDATKSYEAALRLGAETDSGDPETAPRFVSTSRPSRAQIDDVLRNFTGDLLQTPPMHSAIHIEGKRLYEYARAGVEVAREARRVHVFRLEALGLADDELRLLVSCSKGTYVRVLAADIGRALGCGAYLIALRRTSVGPFEIGDAQPLDEIVRRGPEARALLRPPEALVTGCLRVDLEVEAARRFTQGQVVDGPTEGCEAVAVFALPLSRFLGVGRLSEGRLEPLRLLATAAEIP